MVKFTAFFLFFISLSLNSVTVCAKTCDIHIGIADSNVLALSLQPGFCQTYGYEAGKPECTHLAKNSYQSKHLSLHGLWPNQNACGQSYGFCGVKQENNHCDYAPVNLSAEVSNHLKKMMPSYAYGSCLERHEWNKHGSCQVYSADEYYALAMNLVTEVDESVFGEYLRKNQGETVFLSALRDKIEEAFGEKNSGTIYLGCKNKILVDIYIQLPASLPLDESLITLMDKAPSYHYLNQCPAKVTISDFNHNSTKSFS